MTPPARVREMPVSLTPDENPSNTPTTQVDLWVELDRLGRADRAMLAARRDDVRQSRLARRARAALASARAAG
jgi:hypothetical protein